MSSRRRAVLHPVSPPLLIGFVGPPGAGEVGKRRGPGTRDPKDLVLPTRRKKTGEGRRPSGTLTETYKRMKARKR